MHTWKEEDNYRSLSEVLKATVVVVESVLNSVNRCHISRATDALLDCVHMFLLVTCSGRIKRLTIYGVKSNSVEHATQGSIWEDTLRRSCHVVSVKMEKLSMIYGSDRVFTDFFDAPEARERIVLTKTS
jgi:hypothetical protein